jgi:hypothetical protein
VYMAVVNKPNFFIVGAPKCGTTALYSYLAQHPDIFMPSLKEPQFFADDVLGSLRAVRTMENYLNCFADAKPGQTIGEASVAYLGSDSALRGIKAFNPAAEIIVMLRNPIDVMYSEYSGRIYDTREPAIPFEEALEAEDNGRLSPWRCQGGPVLGLGLRQTVRFVDQVRAYFEVFGRGHVHIIIYEDLLQDTAKVYAEVLRVLRVRGVFQPTFKVVNGNKRVRNTSLQKFIVRPPYLARRFARLTIPQPLRRFVGESLLRLNAPFEPRPPMNRSLRRSLQQQLEQDVLALSTLLDRDLSHWVRDGIL